MFGDVRNMGVRAREELQADPDLQLIAGIGGERSIINVRQTAYSYPVGASPTLTLIPAERHFWNVAPEAALFWQALDAGTAARTDRHRLRHSRRRGAVRHGGRRARQQQRT